LELAEALEFAGSRKEGVLTTIRRNGRPQLSNILYLLEDGVFRISVTDERAKTRNLRRDFRASLYFRAMTSGSGWLSRGQRTSHLWPLTATMPPWRS